MVVEDEDEHKHVGGRIAEAMIVNEVISGFLSYLSHVFFVFFWSQFESKLQERESSPVHLAQLVGLNLFRVTVPWALSLMPKGAMGLKSWP